MTLLFVNSQVRRDTKSVVKHAGKETRQNKGREKSDLWPTSRGREPNSSSTLATLKDIRVIQRNLCYVLGLPPSIARKEVNG